MLRFGVVFLLKAACTIAWYPISNRFEIQSDDMSSHSKGAGRDLEVAAGVWQGRRLFGMGRGSPVGRATIPLRPRRPYRTEAPVHRSRCSPRLVARSLGPLPSKEFGLPWPHAVVSLAIQGSASAPDAGTGTSIQPSVFSVQDLHVSSCVSIPAQRFGHRSRTTFFGQLFSYLKTEHFLTEH